MLQLSKSLIDRPVMSLRTGTQVATTASAIINPDNLKIEGLYVVDGLSKGQQLILLNQDVRDIIAQGIVINDHDVLVAASDLIRLKEVIDIGFELFGKQVVTENKTKLGKVTDFATDTSSMYIQKLYVAKSKFKSFSSGSLSIDRSQIIEITNSKIVVKEPLQPERANLRATVTSAVTN